MPTYLSIKDHVYNYLSNAIHNGELKPNEKINEKRICEALDISSTPMREALIELSVQGILENVPRRGFYVREVTPEKARELYTVLGALDALCATLAAEYLTEADYDIMDTLIDQMNDTIESGNFSAYYNLQNAFHNVYGSKCSNEELMRIIAQVKKLFIRQSYENIDDAKLSRILEETNAEHKTILALIKVKDLTRLEEFIKKTHWRTDNALFDVFN